MWQKRFASVSWMENPAAPHEKHSNQFTLANVEKIWPLSQNAFEVPGHSYFAKILNIFASVPSVTL